jgi:hypothetical protein
LTKELTCNNRVANDPKMSTKRATPLIAIFVFAAMSEVALAFTPVPYLSKGAFPFPGQAASNCLRKGRSSSSRLCMLASTAKGSEPDALILKIVRDLNDSELQVIFNKFDVDRSGVISDSDWQSALKSLGLSASKEYTSLLTHFDFNKDGSVDFTDFQRSVDRLRSQYPKTEAEYSATLENWLERSSQTPSAAPIDSVLNSLVSKKVDQHQFLWPCIAC